MRLLITGAAGRIGSWLTRSLRYHYELVLTDVRPPDETYGLPFATADIANVTEVRPLIEGIDTVVHLAADGSPTAPWESVLPHNIIGTYNVFESAHQSGCRRVIFASSVNAILGYPEEVQVNTQMPVRPPNLYGASKAWGEALARFYADQRGLSAICLRFGWVVASDDPALRRDAPELDIALTLTDLTQLVVASIEAPSDLRFGIFHGISKSRWNRLDISDASAMLGYVPQDDPFVLATQ